MNLELNFTFDEMKWFLERNGYIVITIAVNQIRPSYHNNYDNISFLKAIAFKKDEACFLCNNGYDYEEVKDFFIDDIFKKVMKQSLLGLL